MRAADRPAFDAIVLGGGTARRLGGTSKPDVVLAGRRLLDHALTATAQAEHVVAVVPETVTVPAGVRRTLEDPPLGGPVAGVAAGLAALADAGSTAELVLVLSCDSPGVGAAVPRMLAAMPAGGPGGRPDGAFLRGPDGKDQWLTAVYRRAAMRRRLGELANGGAVRGVSVRALVEPLALVAVAADALEVADVDTWADLQRLEEERG